MSRLDEEHGDDEERWLSLGLDKAARLLVVSHTYRDVTPRRGTVRIISARKATRPETKADEEGLATRTGRDMGDLVNHIVESEMRLIGDLAPQEET